MDVIPMCSIFQELQIVHDTGYFSALPSLEEYWQQVTSHSLHLNTQRDRSSRAHVRLFVIEVQGMWVISVNLLSSDSCMWTCKCQTCSCNSPFDLVRQLISVSPLKVALHAFCRGSDASSLNDRSLFNIPVIFPYAQMVYLWYKIVTF